MKNYKRLGFTLAETLITLSIIGALALIVLPGIIKDTMNRTMISAIKGTMTNLNDAVNTEIVNKRVTTLKDTDIHKDPEKFFKTHLAAIKTAPNNSLFANGYKTIDGSTIGVASMRASANLKNGVTLGIRSFPNSVSYFVFIDTNGKREPNIAGIDFFKVLLLVSDQTNGERAGDVACSVSHVYAYDYLVSDCKRYGGDSCYCALERSGFDHKYLEYSYMY